VSTTGEIALLQSLGIDSRRVIHTHPVKRARDIDAAVDFGCETFVVDNSDELPKLLPHRQRVALLVRVGFRAKDAVVDLAKKFGCAPDSAMDLVLEAHRLGFRISGYSFHVGSQCASSQAHAAAVRGCADLMREAESRGVPPFDVLDIGGGFPAPYRDPVPDIDTFCAPIRAALAQIPRDVRIIAEPGRFLAAPCVEGIATIVGKARRGDAVWYYLDDGVYGSYSGKIYDGASYPLSVVPDRAGPLRSSVLAGPTCDSIDVIAENVLLPEMEIGDLIVGGSMGAYTAASASEFNSLPRPKIVVQNDR
jgi:ornithine decarboxylase